MSDPAIEAAEQEWAKHKIIPFNAECLHGQSLISTTREALKPIRELHRPVNTYLWASAHCQSAHEVTNDTATGDDVCLTCTADDGGPAKNCEECFDDDGSNIEWPCATARLIYTAEELA